jgi:predicted dehydrogenase
MPERHSRRDVVGLAGGAVAAAIFPQRARGANDRIAAAFVGVGLMGTADLKFAMQQPELQVTALCDVYQPFLQQAADVARKAGHQPRLVRDFRQILADPSIDVVCVATPDHWHSYITIEACKAGKDVYVEKPVSLTVQEGAQMVTAARRYRRVVQAGTMQRSGTHFRNAVRAVQTGEIGKVVACHTWTYLRMPQQGIGNPPDSNPPPGLDWDMWLGPAPKRPFNRNRFGADRSLFQWSQFRYFWDYAGGMLTDWGVHLIDIVQMTLNEQMPRVVQASGGKLWLTDNRETPDTLQVLFEYPGMIATFETRASNRQSMIARDQGWFDYGIVFYGSEATLYLDRDLYRIIPEKGSAVPAREEKASNSSNAAHWANFLDCVRTRAKPASDIELCHRSSSACHLGNIAYRTGMRIEWEDTEQTIRSGDARSWLRRDQRAPWRNEV